MARHDPAGVLARLAARSTIDPATGCKIWHGARLKNYGVIRVNGKSRRVHRVAWEAVNGPVPDGLELDHTCHTKADCDRGNECPHRPCWNTDHLEPVTHAENVLRGDSPSAKHARQTHCKRGHEFIEHLTTRTKSGGRSCYLCRAEHRANRRSERASEQAQLAERL